ncbi:hypothetical protein GCM10027399_00010 [Curvibacter fontanus]
MAKPDTKTVHKITVKIWRPIFSALKKKTEAACLRRDAYLERVLENELDHLDQEVALANSQASYNYIQGRLDALKDRDPVSLALPLTLTKRLNDICQRKRIVRDAFFNRLFLMLGASPKVIDRCFFPSVDGDWRAHVWSEWKHEGPFFQNGFYPLDPVIDPLWAMRAAFDIYAEESSLHDFICPDSGKTIRVQHTLGGQIELPERVYTTILTKENEKFDLTPFNCYFPDYLIPEHPAQKEHTKLEDLLLLDLGAS